MMDGVVERIGVFALVGLGSGFVSGLFGIGGGIVRIPLFVYLLPLFGVAQSVMMHVAVGTSMALVLPSAIAATRKQLALGNLDLAFFRTWAVGILIGVLVGTALLPYASTELLQVIFAIFMVTVGVYEGFLKDRLVFAHTPPQGAKKVGVASAIGCLAALTGTGGGTMATPILQAFSMKMQAVIAAGERHGRDRRRHRGRLARARPALVLPGLCRSRDLRRDDADDHDRRSGRCTGRSHAQRDLAATHIHRAAVRDCCRPDPKAGGLTFP
jgi:uncharacterized protein